MAKKPENTDILENAISTFLLSNNWHKSSEITNHRHAGIDENAALMCSLQSDTVHWALHC